MFRKAHSMSDINQNGIINLPLK